MVLELAQDMINRYKTKAIKVKGTAHNTFK
jgi:hypothetical protein